MVNDLVSESREIVNNIWWLIDGFDWIVLDDDPTIAKDSAMRIHGDNHSVVEYNPWVALRFLYYQSLLFQLQNFVPLILGLFLFLFFGENVELFDFMGFLCVCFPRNFLSLWVARYWVGYCVYGFVSRVYLWFGFLDLFFVFLDLIEIGFGCWIWGLLEIGLFASWTWEEHEEYFLLVFNLIFSSFHLCSSDISLSSW